MGYLMCMYANHYAEGNKEPKISIEELELLEMAPTEEELKHLAK